jgi:hypothetical protein
VARCSTSTSRGAAVVRAHLDEHPQPGLPRPAGGAGGLQLARQLCAVHRLLDGDNVRQPDILYRTCHANHPCTVWARQTTGNYWWLYQHFVALCDEYTHRYGKVHKTDGLLRNVVSNYPKNIPTNYRTAFALAMGSNPECIHLEDPVRSYREYYQTKQDRFKMVWTKREIPSWFQKAA